MEDLSMDARLLKDCLGDLAVLARGALDQVDHVVDATVFESELLLLVTTVHDGSSEIVCSLSLDYEVEDVVGELWDLLELLSSPLSLLGLSLLLGSVVLVLLIWIGIGDLCELILVRLIVEDVLVVSDPEDPDKVTKRERPELRLDSACLEPVVEVIDVLVVSLLAVVNNQYNFSVL